MTEINIIHIEELKSRNPEANCLVLHPVTLTALEMRNVHFVVDYKVLPVKEKRFMGMSVMTSEEVTIGEFKLAILLN